MTAVTIKQTEVIRTLTQHWIDHAYEGDRLPGERVLARQLGVSRITVKTAMDKLERLGVVDKRGRSGTYLSKRPTSDLIAILGDRTQVRGRGRRSAAAPRAKVVSMPSYRLGVMHCLRPGDQSAGDVISGVSSYFNTRGHELVIGSSRPPGLPGEVVSEFNEKVYRPEVDGLILWATLREQDVPNLARIPVPYVVLSEGSLLLNQNQVILDGTLGCRHAIDQMLRDGHKNAAVLEIKFHNTKPLLRGQCIAACDRASGFQIEHYYSEDPLGDLIASGQKPTALYVNDDVYCSRNVTRFGETGRQLGLDLQVISMAKLHHQNMLPPSIGRMAFDVVELGRQAGVMLERLLDEKLDGLPMLRIGPRYVPPAVS